MSADVKKGYWCTDCRIVTEPVSIYECDNDGWTGTETRCEQCKRFASYRGDGCEDCFAELEEVEVVTDHDGAVVRLSDYEPNGKALAVRRAEAVKDNQKKSKDAYEKKAKEVLASAYEKPWNEVLLGDKIVVKDRNGSFDLTQDATVVSLTTVGASCDRRLTPGSIIAVLEQYGSRLKTFLPTDTAVIRNGAVPVSVVPAEERFILRHGSDTHGSSIKMISAGVGLSTFSDEPEFIAEIIGSTSKYSSAQTTIGSFAQPEDALAFAKAAGEAADELRQMHLFEGAEVEVSWIEDFVPIAHTPTRYACFTVGADDFTQEFGASVRGGSTAASGHTFAVSDAAVLDAIANTAESIAERLRALLGLKA